MSNKEKRSKRKKDDYPDPNEKEVSKASKEEFQIAKWIRKNVPVKKTKFLNHNVEYFSASKVLDALMVSKFAQGENCLFPTRQAAVEFLDGMLANKFFHRAKKVPVSDAELKGRTKGKDTVKETKEGEVELKNKEERATDAEGSSLDCKAEKVDKSVPDKDKKKRKIRLEMHGQQIFVDGHDAYVWIYDPIPMSYWIIGTLVVIGSIVICLFPLWPPALRKGVYYLSIAAAGFLVFLLSLAVIRFVLFCAVWMASGGKHHFWFLPNLTEDVGFVASFKPLYKHEIRETGDATQQSKKNKKKKKDKESDDEGNGETTKKTKADNEVVETKDPDVEIRQRKGKGVDKENEIQLNEETLATKGSASESECSDGSQRSSTGKDFEIIDAEDDEE